MNDSENLDFTGTGQVPMGTNCSENKKTCGWFSIRESEQSGPSCLGVPK